jgi:predicted nucleotidyltransferase
MKQKSYKMEIMNALAKKESYGRELSKLVGTNQMTTSRKLLELREMNVIDFKEEGKNKVYFSKKNNEARNYLFISEHYKLLKVLQKYPQLRKIIDRIQRDEKIEVAILFGSYAKEIAKRDSDIDIFIETNDKKIKGELEKIDSKASVKIGDLSESNLLMKEIERNHVIIKGVEKYYERVRFFKEN